MPEDYQKPSHDQAERLTPSVTFRVAATLVHGFGLSGADAMPIKKELEHKLRSASEWKKYDKPRGHLIGNEFWQHW